MHKGRLLRFSRASHLKPLIFLCLFAMGTEALAHIRWNMQGTTPPRSDATDIKDRNRNSPPPCGIRTRSPNPVALTAGATLEAQWEVAIYHRGYFRIRFSEQGDTGWEETILLDNLREQQGKDFYSAQITLPDIECDQCTLQLVQVMQDRNPPTNYYSCADITLKKADVGDTTPPAPVSGLAAEASKAQIRLNWTNPGSDFVGALVLQASPTVQASPAAGTEYQSNDMIGNASVVSVGNTNSLQVDSLAAQTNYQFAVYAYDAAFNYSAPTRVSAQTPAEEQNAAPEVALRFEQMQLANANGNTVFQDKGTVLVQASVTDQNTNDQHSFDWNKTDPNLTDIDGGDNTFSFNPQNLSEGDYTIMVDVSDNGDPPLTTSESLTLTVAAPAVENSAPTVSFVTQQLGRNRTTAYHTDGKMTVYADVQDADANDTHSFNWVASNPAIVDIDARDSHFVFQAPDVPVGTYKISVTVTDSGTPAKAVNQEVTITVKAKKAGSLNLVWLSIFVLIFFSRRWAKTLD